MPTGTQSSQEGGLAGRVAVVTGAGSGIGMGIALVLAGHGARVVAMDLAMEAAQGCARRLAQEGHEGFAVDHDVRDWDGAGKALARAEQLAGGPVDILVNNAGIYLSTPFPDLSAADHLNLYAVNVSGTFAMCRAALPGMAARRRGKIVNIASVSGKDPFGRSASYGSSKSAVIGMTKSLAKEFGPHNINVNAVCPGLVFTAMQEEQCRRIAAETGRAPEAVWSERLAAVALRRAQEPADIGEAVAFLASERARNITGQAINVCGGQQMMD